MRAQPTTPNPLPPTHYPLPTNTTNFTPHAQTSRQLPLSSYPCYRRSSSSSSEGRWYMLPSSLLCEGDLVGVRKGSTSLEECPLSPLPSPPPSSSSQPPPPPSIDTKFLNSNSKTFRGMSPSLTALINGGELEIMILCGTVLKARARSPPTSKDFLSSRQRVVVRSLLVKFTVAVSLLAVIAFILTATLADRDVPTLRVITQFFIIFLSTSEVVSLTLIASLTEVVGLTRTLMEISSYRSEHIVSDVPTTDPTANEGVSNRELLGAVSLAIAIEEGSERRGARRI